MYNCATAARLTQHVNALQTGQLPAMFASYDEVDQLNMSAVPNHHVIRKRNKLGHMGWLNSIRITDKAMLAAQGQEQYLCSHTAVPIPFARII